MFGSSKHPARWLAIAGILAGGLLLADRAEAKNEFEHAFKHELGRIAAHQAYGIGHQVLREIFNGPRDARHGRGHDRHGYDHYGNDHDRFHRFRSDYSRYWQHVRSVHRGWGRQRHHYAGYSHH